MEDGPLSPEMKEALYKNALDERFVIGFMIGMLTATFTNLTIMYWPQISAFVSSLF